MPATDTLPPKLIKNSFADGVFATVFATLTGGVFLTGFALYLGMSEVAIGLMAAMPYAATLFQLPASILVTRTGRRKGITIFNAACGRLMWLLILAVALLPAGASTVKITLVLVLIFLSHAFISTSYVAWFSWTSDLVPDRLLGRFFGTRNMINGTAGMVTIVGFGFLLDYISRNVPNGQIRGFSLIFVSAVLCGMVSLGFLHRIADLPKPENTNVSTRLADFLQPLRRKNFKSFLTYSLLWNFSVYFASPFFTLYFLRDLGFSYAFTSTMGMIAALADLTAMRLWGSISDRVRNKAVIQACGWITVFLPFLWTFVRPDHVVLPLLLHTLGGAFWAGIHLCTNNLVLRITPREERAICFSLNNIVAGVGATTAPIAAGLAIKILGHADLDFLHPAITPLRFVFLVSTVLRLFSLQLLKFVQEPEEVPVGQLIRILRNVRGLNTTNGFHALLHPFVEAPAADEDTENRARIE
ncbi:MAG: MFS transporter [Desulfobacterales bacterium]|nr:MAG: MFS transporter [Desulfobacterales bacterium]